MIQLIGNSSKSNTILYNVKYTKLQAPVLRNEKSVVKLSNISIKV